MRSTLHISLLGLLASALLGCGGPQDAAEPEQKASPAAAVAQTPGRPGSAFEINYSIVGTPILGSPVAIDLEIRSAYADEEIEIGYQVPDPGALAIDEAQPLSLRRVPSPDDHLIHERVTVVPQREGRLYINVSAARSDGEGSSSTMISIPIHVGDVDTSIREHGELETGEDGENTRVLTSE